MNQTPRAFNEPETQKQSFAPRSQQDMFKIDLPNLKARPSIISPQFGAEKDHLLERLEREKEDLTE
jgi:hypothetical protein